MKQIPPSSFVSVAASAAAAIVATAKPLPPPPTPGLVVEGVNRRANMIISSIDSTLSRIDIIIIMMMDGNDIVDVGEEEEVIDCLLILSTVCFYGE